MSFEIEINHSSELADGRALDDPRLFDLLHAAVAAALNARAVGDAAISITLVDDSGIAQLNQQYLAHEGPTDVISFPLYEGGERPVGDIYIGVEQARRQSDELAVPLAHELARLAIHGTLHVLGLAHPEDGDREQSEMWRLQERLLKQVTAS